MPVKSLSFRAQSQGGHLDSVIVPVDVQYEGPLVCHEWRVS